MRLIILLSCIVPNEYIKQNYHCSYYIHRSYDKLKHQLKRIITRLHRLNIHIPFKAIPTKDKDKITQFSGQKHFFFFSYDFRGKKK